MAEDTELCAQMQAAGHTDPAHQEIAEQAVAAGVNRGLFLDWLRGNSGKIWEIIQALLKLQGTPPS